MDPNEQPQVTLPDGRSAFDVFGEHTVAGIWPHVLVPNPGGPPVIAATLHQLLSAGVITPPAQSPWSFEELAQALWDARRAQQAGWSREGWPLERIARRLRADGVVAEWALPVDNDADAVDALAPHRAAGLRGAVFVTEAQAVELALAPGDAHVTPEAFVQLQRRGLFGRREFPVDQYKAGCESVARSLVAAARAEGVSAVWDGNWERAVVLEDIQYVVPVPWSPSASR